MKRLVVVIVFLYTINNVLACLRADQNRAFPVGMCSRGLVVVEMHLYRSEMRTTPEDLKMTPEWQGYTFLSIYSNDNKLIEFNAIDTLIGITEKEEQSAVEKSYLKGLALAKKIPDLILAKPVSIIFNNYKIKSRYANLELDTIKCLAFVRLRSGRKHLVSVLNDSASIASNYIGYYSEFDYDSTESKAKSLVQGLLMNSLRVYKIGKVQLTVVHLGMGDIREEEKNAEVYKPDFAFSKIEESTFIEPVLHHGHGFDFIMIE